MSKENLGISLVSVLWFSVLMAGVSGLSAQWRMISWSGGHDLLKPVVTNNSKVQPNSSDIRFLKTNQISNSLNSF